MSLFFHEAEQEDTLLMGEAQPTLVWEERPTFGYSQDQRDGPEPRAVPDQMNNYVHSWRESAGKLFWSLSQTDWTGKMYVKSRH